MRDPVCSVGRQVDPESLHTARDSRELPDRMIPRLARCFGAALLVCCAPVPALEPLADTPIPSLPTRLEYSAGADSVALVRLITVDPNLLSMLHVRVTDGAGARSFDGSDFSTTTADGPGFDPQVAPFKVRSPGTVEVELALLKLATADTLAAMTFWEPVYRGYTHTVIIKLGGHRPIGVMASDVYASVLRRPMPMPGYDHDTVFVSWTFYSRATP